MTDKLRSYGVAYHELIPEAIHSTKQYENNRSEQSHENTRVRERVMRQFKSVGQAQRFLSAHAAVSNLFNLGRHQIRAEHYRNLLPVSSRQISADPREKTGRKVLRQIRKDKDKIMPDFKIFPLVAAVALTTACSDSGLCLQKGCRELGFKTLKTGASRVSWR